LKTIGYKKNYIGLRNHKKHTKKNRLK